MYQRQHKSGDRQREFAARQLNRTGDCALSPLHSDCGAGLIIDQRGNQLVHRIGIEVGVIQTGPLG